MPRRFLLSVVGPHSTGPVRFPVVDAELALYHDEDFGPCFSGGMFLYPFSGSPADDFSDSSTCGIDGNFYEDVLGKSWHSLTGAPYFTPVEVEVFSAVLL